jgi:hypothetical protein
MPTLRQPTTTTFLLLALLALATGCSSSPETRIYRVTVRNKTDGPITVGLTKNGPPQEPGWLSPEEMTDIPPSRRPDHWGQVLDKDMKASVKVEGKFDADVHAFLRVYRGTAPIADLLAKSHGTGSRADVALTPTVINDYTIEDHAGQITPRLTSLTPKPSH